MRKIFLLVVVILFATFAAKAQYFQVDTARLNMAYSELVKNPHSKEAQEAFISAFPNNWSEFITTYGFCSKDGYDLTMYNTANEHIAALGSKLSLITDTTYCRKLLNIAVGGVYGADAPNYLNKILHHAVQENEDVMLHCISQLRKGHQMQFWQFYWSCNGESDEREEEFNRLYGLNANIYPYEMATMEIAFRYFHNGVNVDGGYWKGSGVCYDNDGEYVFPVLDTRPEFPGGIKALMEWIDNNLHYPQECLEQKVEGISYVRFVVRKDGSLDNVELLKSSGNNELDKEALRLMRDNDMPKWSPAKLFNVYEGEFVAVDCVFLIPVVF